MHTLKNIFKTQIIWVLAGSLVFALPGLIARPSYPDPAALRPVKQAVVQTPASSPSSQLAVSPKPLGNSEYLPKTFALQPAENQGLLSAAGYGLQIGVSLGQVTANRLVLNLPNSVSGLNANRLVLKVLPLGLPGPALSFIVRSPVSAFFEANLSAGQLPGLEPALGVLATVLLLEPKKLRGLFQPRQGPAGFSGFAPLARASVWGKTAVLRC